MSCYINYPSAASKHLSLLKILLFFICSFGIVCITGCSEQSSSEGDAEQFSTSETESVMESDYNPEFVSNTESEAISEPDSISDDEMSSSSDMLPKFDTLFFGTYPQSDDSNQEVTPIEWLILNQRVHSPEEDILGNQENELDLLVISRYALDSRTVCAEYKETTWEESDLRAWLNNEFFVTAFTEEEQSRILVTTVTADANPEFDTPQGTDTLDRIFLLSTNEVKQFFSGNDADLRCAPTDYAASLLSYENDRYTAEGRSSCWWWLRTMGADSTSMSLVRIEGTIFNNGHFVDSESGCIRPAMWITLKDQK